jgi:hypothetical protein
MLRAWMVLYLFRAHCRWWTEGWSGWAGAGRGSASPPLPLSTFSPQVRTGSPDQLILDTFSVEISQQVRNGFPDRLRISHCIIFAQMSGLSTNKWFPVAKFIVPYWGIKSTMSKDCQLYSHSQRLWIGLWKHYFDKQTGVYNLVENGYLFLPPPPQKNSVIFVQHCRWQNSVNYRFERK